MRTLQPIAAGCSLVFVCVLSACLHSPREKEVGKLSPQQLKEVIAQDKDVFFLDVRTPQEIQELGTLPGYVNIPIDQLERRLSEIPKDRTIVTA